MATVTELGQRVKAKYPGQYDDLSDDEVGRKVKARFPGQYDDFTDSAPQLSAMPSPSQRMRNRFTAALPAVIGGVGGLAGGAVGGPLGAVGGAAAGGDIGYRLRQAVIGQPADTRQAEGAGLGQAAAEVLGRGIGTVAGRMGRSFIPKTVTFQKPPTPSVILNEFGQPFMHEGQIVTFQKGATKGAKQAADMALDAATHSVPGGFLVRPAMRGLRNKLAPGAGAGNFLTSKGFQNFARQFPRAAAALWHVAMYQEPDSTTAPFARRK